VSHVAHSARIDFRNCIVLRQFMKIFSDAKKRALYGKKSIAAMSVTELMVAALVLAQPHPAYSPRNFLEPYNNDWQSGVSIYTRGATTTVPSSNVVGNDVKVNPTNITKYTGNGQNNHWVALVDTAQVADGASCTSDKRFLQASLGYDTTNGLVASYGVLNDTGALIVSDPSPTSVNSGHTFWLQIYYSTSDSKWHLDVVDSTTSTVVVDYKYTDPYSGTTIRTNSDCTGFINDWGAVESPDTSNTYFPSGFGSSFLYAQYAQYVGGSLNWYSLSQVYSYWESIVHPSNIYCAAKSGGTPYQCGSIGSGFQTDATLENI
jgi:hypothetical protein